MHRTKVSKSDNRAGKLFHTRSSSMSPADVDQELAKCGHFRHMTGQFRRGDVRFAHDMKDIGIVLGSTQAQSRNEMVPDVNAALRRHLYAALHNRLEVRRGKIVFLNTSVFSRNRFASSLISRKHSMTLSLSIVGSAFSPSVRSHDRQRAGANGYRTLDHRGLPLPGPSLLDPDTRAGVPSAHPPARYDGARFRSTKANSLLCRVSARVVYRKVSTRSRSSPTTAWSNRYATSHR